MVSMSIDAKTCEGIDVLQACEDITDNLIDQVIRATDAATGRTEVAAGEEWTPGRLRDEGATVEEANDVGFIADLAPGTAGGADTTYVRAESSGAMMLVERLKEKALNVANTITGLITQDQKVLKAVQSKWQY